VANFNLISLLTPNLIAAAAAFRQNKTKQKKKRKKTKKKPYGISDAPLLRCRTAWIG